MKLLSFFISLAFFCSPALAETPVLPTAPLSIQTLAGQNHVFEVEVANTYETRRDGLMNRLALAPDRGMLFVFDDVTPLAFWMKNTLITLDILFIREDGVITNIHQYTPPNDLTPRRSAEAVRWALELPGGRTKELGITAGSVVTSPAMNAGAKN